MTGLRLTRRGERLALALIAFAVTVLAPTIEHWS